MSTTPKLDELDLSKLTDQEKSTLDDAYHTSNISWKVGLFLGLLNLYGAYSIWNAFGSETAIISLVAIKALGYLALGYWAKSWSVIACLSLLVWHVYFTFELVYSDSLSLKLTFIIPLLLLAWGLLGAYTKTVLIKKSRRENED